MRIFNIISFFILMLPSFVLGGDISIKNLSIELEDGSHVRLKRLQSSDNIKEHVYIKLEPKSVLVLRYNISDFTDVFIKDFICSHNFSVIKNHIFGERNVELNIVEQSVVDVMFTGGLELHLRGDVKNDKNYQTFKNKHAIPKIVNVEGDVFLLNDTDIVKKNFPSLFLDTYHRYYPTDAISTITDDSGTTSEFEIHSDFFKPYSIPNIKGSLDGICHGGEKTGHP